MFASDTGEQQKYGTIVIVGGGCYGSYYVRQLRRARTAGAVAWERVTVVDRDASCAFARSESMSAAGSPDGVHLVVADWRAFFHDYLGRASNDPAGTARDAIVPSPLMPHLMFEWILGRARARWPERRIVTAPLETPPATPWQRASPDGPHYVSFADWICPINCVEPRICPHTRELRTWTLPRSARAYVESEQDRGRPLVGPVIFHCTHRAYGVGMFDTREVLEGDDFVRSAAEENAADVLIGTMSHCHGAFERLVIDAPSGRGSVTSRHW